MNRIQAAIATRALLWGKLRLQGAAGGESEASHLEHITDGFRGNMDKEASVGCDDVEIFKDFSTSSGY